MATNEQHCSCCPVSAVLLTRLQIAPGIHVDGPSYCVFHFGAEILVLVEQYLTVTVLKKKEKS
jgi:hypothetical protein